ncbi:MAG: hypothetical protein Q4D96_10115 [Propionibacteriaceae bacterium]|nr:hypothetical protein [Propionibacteriaceae bacterium]
MKPWRTLGLLAAFIVVIYLGYTALTSHQGAQQAQNATTPTISTISQSGASPLTAAPGTASAAPLEEARGASSSPLLTASPTVELPDVAQVAQPTIEAGDVEPVSVDGVDMSDPDAVADLMVTTASTSDTATDTSWLDAMRRARSVMTPELADQVMAEIPGGQDGSWLELEKHHGRTEVSVEPSLDGVPDDTATEASRVRVATRTPVGDDDWRGQAVQTAYYLTLVMRDGQWRVSQVQSSDYMG